MWCVCVCAVFLFLDHSGHIQGSTNRKMSNVMKNGSENHDFISWVMKTLMPAAAINCCEPSPLECNSVASGFVLVVLRGSMCRDSQFVVRNCTQFKTWERCG